MCMFIIFVIFIYLLMQMIPLENTDRSDCTYKLINAQYIIEVIYHFRTLYDIDTDHCISQYFYTIHLNIRNSTSLLYRLEERK